MLDTGSSVSIMGDELFVQIAPTIGLDKSTVKSPQVLLRNFSDGEIHVTSCVPLCLVHLFTNGRYMRVQYLSSDRVEALAINVCSGRYMYI